MSWVNPSGSQVEPQSADECPRCGASVTDAGSSAICTECGAILNPARRRVVRAGTFALILGGSVVLLEAVVLLLGGGTIHESISLAATVVSVFIAGGAAALFGAVRIGQTFRAVTSRESTAARALLDFVDKLSLGTLAVLVLVCLPLGYRLVMATDQVRPAVEAAFAGKLEPFAVILDDKAEENDPEEGEAPKINGRVLVLDKGSRMVPGVTPGGISAVHFDLPRTLRATQPDQVGTVVWLKWSRKDRGKYRTGTAYKVNCEVIIIDAEKRAVVARRPFEGGEPPSSVPAGKDGYGALPTERIVEYLTSLPRE